MNIHFTGSRRLDFTAGNRPAIKEKAIRHAQETVTGPNLEGRPGCPLPTEVVEGVGQDCFIIRSGAEYQGDTGSLKRIWDFRQGNLPETP